MENKIILVENNPVVIKLFTKVLETSGYSGNLSVAGKYTDYLKMLKKQRPKIIFTGRTLNGFTANQVLEAKNKFAPKAPTYVLMATPRFDSNIELIENGAYDIILYQDLKRVNREIVNHKVFGDNDKKIKYNTTADNYTKHLLSII